MIASSFKKGAKELVKKRSISLIFLALHFLKMIDFFRKKGGLDFPILPQLQNDILHKKFIAAQKLPILLAKQSQSAEIEYT